MTKFKLGMAAAAAAVLAFGVAACGQTTTVEDEAPAVEAAPEAPPEAPVDATAPVDGTTTTTTPSGTTTTTTP